MSKVIETTSPSTVRYFDVDYIQRVLVELCQTPSPTGRAEPGLELVERELRALGVAASRTRKGALIAQLGSGGAPRDARLLSAHVDTLGAMVKGIKDNGRLWLTQIGEYAWDTVEGEYCLVHTHTGRAISGTILTTHASAHILTWAIGLLLLDNCDFAALRRAHGRGTRVAGALVVSLLAIEGANGVNLNPLVLS